MPVPRQYLFYGEANLLTGQIGGAAPVTIPEQAFQRLSIYGGDLTSPPTGFSKPGLVLIGNNSTTHVKGNPIAGGWQTVVTSTANNVDIGGGMITADAIVAQITTDYPLVGNVPTVSFAGTTYTNLKINKVKVTPKLNLNVCTPKPPLGLPYIADPALLAFAAGEYHDIANSGAPAGVAGQFSNWSLLAVQSRGKVDCSLVTGVDNYPGQSFGHVIIVPNLGNIYLAELSVGNHIELTMLHVDITAGAGAQLRTVTVDTQGHGMP